jgi:RluA family pseudouridine synthase
MARLKQSCLVGPKHTGARLDVFLALWLPVALADVLGSTTISKTKVRQLLMAGAIRVNNIVRTSPGMPLPANARVDLELPREDFLAHKDPGDIAYEFTARDIIYEDQWILVANKPSGLPSESGRLDTRKSFVSAIADYLKSRETEVEPYLGVHHRLDKETSGLMIFSRSKEANHGLHEAFRLHHAHKTYLALSAGRADFAGDSTSVTFDMGRISPLSAAAKWGAVEHGGQESTTDLSVLDASTKGTLFAALPRTGRTHQIRVHLQSLGCPLLGDELYDGALSSGGLAINRVMLHAYKLAIPHPMTGEDLLFELPPPADFLAALTALNLDPQKIR